MGEELICRVQGPAGSVVEGVGTAKADESAVHAIVPPLSLRGPVLTTRRFSRVPSEADDLVRTRGIGPRALRFLAACVRGRANMVISGGAGSGKTTLLGVLSSFIPDEERLTTMEDAAELRLAKPHAVSLEARPANVEGSRRDHRAPPGPKCPADATRRIIVGEVHGGEALDMLQAMNTGHEGSLSTAHANLASRKSRLPPRVVLP